jgi:hypothetical protein
MYHLTLRRITQQFTHSLCLCVSYGYQNTQRLFYYPALTDCVWNCPHCVVYETELNSYILMRHVFQNHAMDQVVSQRSFTAEDQARSQTTACVFCGGQIGNGTGYPPGTSVATCQYYSINPSFKSSS